MSVARKSAAVSKMLESVAMIDALMDGTQAMREAGEAYLPKWPMEDQESYDYRLRTATLFPAYASTVDALSGKPFSEPLGVEGGSSEFGDWLNDVDLQGRNLHSFSADVIEDAIAKSLAGVLVEYPKAHGIKTRADEKREGVRPYLVHIKLNQLLGWRCECVKGNWQLTQLRFMETVHEQDGEYGEKEVPQIRVLEPGLFQIHRQNAKKQWVLHEEGTTTLKEIPFVPVYGQRVGFMQAVPPLLPLAYLNIKHWQTQSTQDNALRVVRMAILFLKGFRNDGPVVVGSSHAISTENDQADAKFVEHTGAGIDSGAKDIEKLENQMRMAGAELLVDAPVKSVAQWSGENAARMSSLKRIALDFQDALNQALQIMGRWVGLEAPVANVYTDFGSLSLNEASAELLDKVGQSGVLSRETRFEELKRRGLIAPERQWPDELDRLADDGPDLASLAIKDDGSDAERRLLDKLTDGR